MLPKLCSADLGSPSEPGEYGYGEAMVQVDHHHLEVWREQPDAVFPSVLLNRVGDDRLRLMLTHASV